MARDVIVKPARIEIAPNVRVSLICLCGAEISWHPRHGCERFRGDLVVVEDRPELTIRNKDYREAHKKKT